MATKTGQEYLCELCGNKVRVLEQGEGKLVCCGEAMKLVKDVPEGTPATPSGP